MAVLVKISGGTIYLGPPDVTIQTGFPFPMPAATILNITLGPAEELFGVVETGEAVIGYIASLTWGG